MSPGHLGAWQPWTGIASRSSQPALCPAQDYPPEDPSLCWPSRDGLTTSPQGSRAMAFIVPSPSPVPSLRPTGKCLLYCNGVLEPLYLCPNGARCATWFQDPTRFTGTMVRSSRPSAGSVRIPEG